MYFSAYPCAVEGAGAEGPGDAGNTSSSFYPGLHPRGHDHGLRVYCQSDKE
ncbi:hypothetical protein GCM10009647_031620 [Streptomyces sanglieri]